MLFFHSQRYEEKREQENKQSVVEQRVGVAFFLSISCFPTVLGPRVYDRISKSVCGRRDACQCLFKFQADRCRVAFSCALQNEESYIVLECLLEFPDGRFLFPFSVF
jgi:hypothetical protein